jgi:hypothetical protein
MEAPVTNRLWFVLGGLFAMGLLLTWWFSRTPFASDHPGQDAERALPSARTALLEGRCARRDAGSSTHPSPGQLSRACAGLREAETLEHGGQALEAATRLMGLARESPTSDEGSREAIEAVRAERVRLLVLAGHSREAALEGERWASSDGDVSLGRARLWFEAGRAEEVLGDQTRANSDYRQALEFDRH